MLPYLDQQALYDKYDQTANWSQATVNTTGFPVPNSTVAATRIPALECPSSNPSPADPSRLDDDPDPKSQVTPKEKGTSASPALRRRLPFRMLQAQRRVGLRFRIMRRSTG